MQIYKETYSLKKIPRYADLQSLLSTNFPWIFVIANALHFDSNSCDLNTAFTVLELLATQQIPSLPSSLDAPVTPHLHIQLAPADCLPSVSFLFWLAENTTKLNFPIKVSEMTNYLNLFELILKLLIELCVQGGQRCAVRYSLLTIACRISPLPQSLLTLIAYNYFSAS